MRDSVSFLHRVSAWTEKVGMTDDESTLIKMAITITVAILIYISCRKDQKYLGRYPLRSGFFP